MKNFTLFILLNLTISPLAFPGIGGSSGGSGATAMNMDSAIGYTSEVCAVNEAGQRLRCRMKFFKNKPNPFNFQPSVNCAVEAEDGICEMPLLHPIQKGINGTTPDPRMYNGG